MEQEWHKYYNEAVSYFKAAKGAALKDNLGNTVLYNIISMSVENFMIATLVKKNLLPEHSSISGMLKEMKKHYSVPDSFIHKVRFMNRFMNFCSLEVLPTPEISKDDIEKMMAFLFLLKDWSEDILEVVVSQTQNR